MNISGRVENGGLCSYTNRVISNFVLIFRNFRYHDNEGWFVVNFDDIVKSADPEKPLFGARMFSVSRQETPVWYKCLARVSCISRVIANFVLKFPNFVTVATRVTVALG